MSPSLHIRWMRRGIQLALKGKGLTSPNPIVGALIVRGNRLVSEGYHRKAGLDHAEVVAIKKGKMDKIRRATLYVTMEPCCLHGKTPPCISKIIESGIKRVVIGAKDPNPQVNGRGIRLLKKAGIEVIEGVLKEDCENLNRPFQKFITTKLPYVTLKAALSLDGKIATRTGESRWITNDLSRRYVHRLREEVDAVLIGGRTFNLDDPRLTVRLPRRKKKNHPIVVVVGSKLDLSRGSKIFKAGEREIIFASTNGISQRNRVCLKEKGVQVLSFRGDLKGRVPLKELLYLLGKKGVTHLLVEGGGEVFSSFVSKRLFDRVVLFYSPKILGGEALDWLPEVKTGRIQDALELKPTAVRRLGGDILFEGMIK